MKQKNNCAKYICVSTLGVGVTLQVGFFTYSIQLLGTVTSGGNWSLDLALASGVSTSVGFGISVGGMFMLSDIDSIADVEGYGANIGGTYAPKIKAGKLSLGVEANFIGDFVNGDTAHKGITISINYDWFKFDTSVSDSLLGKFDNPAAEGHWSQANTIHLLDADILERIKENVMGYVD